MERGHIYRVFKPGDDPKRYRAYVIVSRQALVDSGFSTVICAPIHSAGTGMATQVPVGVEEGLKHSSWIMCDNLMSIHKADLTQYLGSIPQWRMIELDAALRIALSLRGDESTLTPW